MPDKHLTRKVTGCKDCPFAQHAKQICTLHSYKISIADCLREGGLLLDVMAGTAPEACPPECPLIRNSCLVRLTNSKRKLGRPGPGRTPGRDFEAEVADFLKWLRAGGELPAATFFAKKTIWGPALAIHHLRKALAGHRPFEEMELDTLVRWATTEGKYPGFTPPPVDDEGDNFFTNL